MTTTATADPRNVFSITDVPRGFVSLSDVRLELGSADYSRTQNMALDGEIESLKLLTLAENRHGRVWINPDNMKCLDEEVVRLLQERLRAVRDEMPITDKMKADARGSFNRPKIKTRLAREAAQAAQAAQEALTLAANKQAKEEAAAAIAIAAAVAPTPVEKAPSFAEHLLAALEASTSTQVQMIAALNRLEKIWAS